MAQTYKETDFVGLILLLWSRRKTLLVACFIGGILSIIVAFSIPKQYTSTTVLAPEMSSAGGIGGSLGSLASMAGFDLGSFGGDEAIYPELYPQIISSTPFLCELMALPVQSKDGSLRTDLYHYLRYEQRYPWWTNAMMAPIKAIKRLTVHTVDTVMPSPSETNSLVLTRSQLTVMSNLDKRIRVDVDKGNSVITLGVTMQDPLIAAFVAQNVSDNLQKYVGNYRSAKARKDLAYTESLYEDTKEKFYAAQQAYAEYADRHQGVALMQYQIEQDRLENEKDLAFNVYNQVAQQLELSRAKVAEKTPVCVIMQPPTVPFKASSPKKMMMGVLYCFLAFFGTAAWIIIKDRIVRQQSSEHAGGDAAQ